METQPTMKKWKEDICLELTTCVVHTSATHKIRKWTFMWANLKGVEGKIVAIIEKGKPGSWAADILPKNKVSLAVQKDHVSKSGQTKWREFVFVPV